MGLVQRYNNKCIERKVEHHQINQINWLISKILNYYPTLPDFSNSDLEYALNKALKSSDKASSTVIVDFGPKVGEGYYGGGKYMLKQQRLQFYLIKNRRIS